MITYIVNNNLAVSNLKGEEQNFAQNRVLHRKIVSCVAQNLFAAMKSLSVSYYV